MKNFQIVFFIILVMESCSGQIPNEKTSTSKPVMNKEKNEEKINKSDDEWRKQLTPGQFYILREKGTEYPFTGKFYKHNEKGIYTCSGCGTELFSSETKFDAGCGWPSFYESLNSKVDTAVDNTHGMIRIEIKCKKCGGHLGHVFNDGPQPTGLRYCVNSESLDFKK